MTEENKRKYASNRDVDEDSPLVKEDIQRLRTMIEEEEGLHLRTDERFLLRHLYGAHFDVDLAFKKIQDFFKLKIKHPGWYFSKPLKEYKPLLALHTHGLLPERDSKGRRIFLIRMGNIDSSKMTVEDMSALDEIFSDAIADEPETQRNGTAVLTDMSGYSYRNLAWLTPSNLKIAAAKAECAIIRETHNHHVVKSSMLLNAAFTLMFPFLSDTIKNQVHFHYDNFEDLHKHINPEILPEEYGGTAPPLDYDAIYERFIFSQESKLEEEIKEGYVTENQPE